ncbi:hypothetical protein FisN_5Hh194 [Fistulifera solaris]|jgi:uncharacterized metal-binding protein YceD (DUF177 family)|uniref:DUF177 domain-containing protein n=1 Tax=Fistulifera solaris TaxID=1519565 RepID=A0A1Z5JSJ7_FISSO|nr:hypothetical protein FisN_5Hh194 [Fistulifera solaris]|eukprot:GAX16822.1 hypothetical protein FisN_5Hh194 [Fistulifera solaris]
MRSCLTILILKFFFVKTSLSFTVTPTAQRQQSRISTSQLHVALPPNEFSRTVDLERILKKATRQRGYQTEIVATKQECDALAKRFSLPYLASLQADLSVNWEMAQEGVQVEGTMKATLTRKCVRTNDDFTEDIELPLFAIVRPVVPLSLLALQQQQLEDQFAGKQSNNKKKQSRAQSFDAMDVAELQRLLQIDIRDEEDVLMEDEAIYATDGPLDLGELVAQLFWLGLDPYPKKPGTDPIQISITG